MAAARGKNGERERERRKKIEKNRKARNRVPSCVFFAKRLHLNSCFLLIVDICSFYFRTAVCFSVCCFVRTMAHSMQFEDKTLPTPDSDSTEDQ